MKRFIQVILIVGAAAACSNPVEPAQKFMADPPLRIDPTPKPSGFQLNHTSINHP